MIDDPLGFVTGSLDKHIKVWSIYGELWGDLNIVNDYPIIQWNFPYSWKNARENDKLEVINIMKELEPETEKDLKEIEFVEEEPLKVKKLDDQEADILPDRS